MIEFNCGRTSIYNYLRDPTHGNKKINHLKIERVRIVKDIKIKNPEYLKICTDRDNFLDKKV